MLKLFEPKDFMHTRSSWEGMGVKNCMLPRITTIDPISRDEFEAPITMNGIEIDPSNVEVIHRFQNLSTFPSTVMHKALGIVETIFKKYIDDDDLPQRNHMSHFEILELVQRMLIILQNLLFA